MKKFKQLTALLMCASMLFTACGSGNAPASSGDTAAPAASDASQAPAADGAKKLVFWDKSEYVAEYNTMMKASVEKFGQEQNVEVDYVVIPPNDLKQKLMAAIEAGNPPDLIVGDDMLCAQFVAMDQIATVDDVLSGMELTDSAVTLSQLSGEQVLVPLAFLAPGMYWRKDKWDEKGLPQPTTWEELREHARQITDAKNGFYALGMPMGASGGGDAESFMRSLILSFGGVPVDETGKVTINSPETLEALKFAASLYQEGLCPPDAITWDDGGNNAAYLAGTVGIVFNSGSIWSALGTENPDLQAKTQVISYPAGPSGKAFTPGGANTFAIFKTGKNADTAKEFVKYFFSDLENYDAMVQAMGGMWQPVIKGLDDNDFWKDPLNAGWLANSQNIVRNFHPAPADELANVTFSNQLCVKAVQNIVVNNADPQAALDQLEAEFKTAYGQ